VRVANLTAPRERICVNQKFFWLSIICLACVPALLLEAAAASYELLSIESVFGNPARIRQILPRGIVVTSSRQRYASLPSNTQKALQDYFVYQIRVRVEGAVYYRLIVGNFRSQEEAQARLKKLRPIFSDAWIYQRTQAERQSLAAYLATPAGQSATAAATSTAETAEDQLKQAREAFLDENYTRVVSLANRVLNSGNLEQSRAALELAGAARERQGRFAQAMTLYETLLDTEPGEELSARIRSRMEGIRTMSIEPKNRLQTAEENPDDKKWIYRSLLQQYYRDDVLQRPGEGSESVNQVLVTDIDMQIQRRTEANSLSIEIDAGLIADLMEDSTEGRISQASLSYTSDDLRIIGGRQRRTVKGVYGLFDGITYVDLSRSAFQASYFAGTLAQSSFDGLQSEQPLAGLNVDFSPRDWLDLSLYLVHQEISGLTDRQAIGSEFQIRHAAGFVYGIVDYDVFYEDLNNIRFVSNYRHSRQWSFNLTLDQVKSPTLSTLNALQGQAVTSIDKLSDIYSDDQIYQLAKDRAGKSQSLYFSSNYIVDDNRQLNLDFSIFELDDIPASGGVSAIAAIRETSVSLDYSVRNLFSTRDYSSMGIRLSDSDTSEIRSLRFRSRITGNAAITYDPRFQLDFRESSSGVDQTILKPSLRMRYRVGKKLNLEADLGIEYSDLDLPDFDQQTAYSLYLGYVYFF